MITNIRKYINSIFSVKLGDIIYDGDPKNVVRPSYKIVCGENDMIKTCKLFYINDMVFDNVKNFTGNIYKIEDIKIEDIKHMLKILINDNSIDRIKLFGNVIDIWIKRYPIVKEFVENIITEIDSDKYNL